MALAFLLVLGVFLWLSSSLPRLEGEEKLAALAAPVHVLRDENGAPHVFAGSAHDAYVALGYLHAQDRLFQMEMTRRAGAGRLAEVLGADLLGYDKKMRALGLARQAEKSFFHLPQDVKNDLGAYAEGVNAFLTQRKNPPEFTLLGITPAPWAPWHGLIWAKMMAWQLSGNMENEIFRAGLLKEGWTRAQVDALFPRPSVQGFSGALPLSAPPVRSTTPLAALARFFDHLPGQASNIYALTGARTQSGKPILANDPHLQLQAPILWYLARLHWPEGDVKGASAPGLPYFPLGQNRHMAWGFTTSNIDVQDLVFIDAKDVSLAQKREEIIHVKGAADVTLPVSETAAGPVLSGVIPMLDAVTPKGKVAVLQWTGFSDHDSTAAFLARLNNAVRVNEVAKKTDLYLAPPQNLMLADEEGHIGIFSVGLLPQRAGENTLYADQNARWPRFVPQARNPRRMGPPAQFLFNANNAPLPASACQGACPFEGDFAETFRAQRLQQLLEPMKRADVSRASAPMNDIRSLAAQAVLVRLLPLLEDSEVKKALAGWDGAMDKTRPEPLIFHALIEELGRQLFGDVYAAEVQWPRMQVLIHALDLEKDALKEKVKDSVAAAMATLGKTQGADWTQWRWGTVHTAPLSHPVFSKIPLLSALFSLEVETDGDYYTLQRAASYDPAHPFRDEHGAGYRAAYDLGAPAQSLFMMATGTSGHPLSPFYGNMTARWKDGQYVTLAGSEEELRASGARTLTLHP